MPTDTAQVIHMKEVSFGYPGTDFSLQIPEFRLSPGNQLAITGPSGCGKSTFFKLVSGIIVPQRGTIEVAGTNLSQLSERKRRAFRVQDIGYVFQDFGLIDYLTAYENIVLPTYISSRSKLTPERRQRAYTLAEQVGISRSLLKKKPRHLSQGECQRVAVCRALVTKPQLLLADEPTGNLDPENAASLIDLLTTQAKDYGATLIIITHDHRLLHHFDETLHLPDLMMTNSPAA